MRNLRSAHAFNEHPGCSSIAARRFAGPAANERGIEAVDGEAGTRIVATPFTDGTGAVERASLVAATVVLS